MIYLEKKDLIAVAFERFIDESSLDQPYIIDNTEKKGIEILKTTLGTRYNVNLIFDPIAPIKNELLIEILATWVVYKIIKRNAARKVPVDYKEDYDEAMKQLKDIATGVIVLDGVPTPTDENGNPVKSNTIFGNNKNKDFYI
jgi:phage gp36-like protein